MWRSSESAKNYVRHIGFLVWIAIDFASISFLKFAGIGDIGLSESASKLRRTISTMIALLLIASMFLLPRVQLGNAESHTIKVPQDYSTIQGAIDAASPGDTVTVKSGTYFERLVVSKRINLIGEDQATTIIDGGHIEAHSCLAIYVDDAYVTGFKLINAGRLAHGIFVNGESCRIERNTVIVDSDQLSGISICKANNIIKYNIIQGPESGAGILVYSFAPGNTIDENKVTAALFGVFLWGASNNIITDNVIEENDEGIMLMSYMDRGFPSGNDIIRNTIKKNHYRGIYFDAFNLPIQYNNIHHNNFLANAEQVGFAQPSGVRSNWDNGYPSGGNYWSDYSSVDQHSGPNQDQPGSDGIGDVSVTINSINIDHYPLMRAFAPENPYKKLADGRSGAYGAFLDIFSYYRTQKSQDYDKTLLAQALTNLVPFLTALSQLGADEIAQDVAGQIKDSANVIKSFKDWLDSLEEPIRQSTISKVTVATAHADLVSLDLTSLKALCEEEASAYETDLGTVKTKLADEKSMIDHCLFFAVGFRSCFTSTYTEFTVANDLMNFLDQDKKAILHVLRAINNEKLASYTLECSADLHVYDSEGRHDGPIYDTNGNVTAFEEDIPDSYYIGFGSDPQEVLLLNPADSYTILVLGRGNNTPSEFTLTSDLFDRAGFSLDAQNVTRTIINNETQAFASEVSTGNLTLSKPQALYFSPFSLEKAFSDVGSYFNVTLMAQNMTNLYGFDLNVTWDDSLLTLQRCYYNETLDGLWGANNWVVAVDSTGPNWRKLVALSTKDSFNATADQALFTFEFRVEEPDTNSFKETYIHFGTHKLSDSLATSIKHSVADGVYRIRGRTPMLQMSETVRTCRTYGENFTIAVGIANASNVEDCEFEIHYNSTLLSCTEVTWTAWGSGTLLISETEGTILGATSGSLVSGNVVLLTLKFTASFYHFWKDQASISDWENNLTDTIFIQRANLSYPSCAKLQYERPVLSDVEVGPDFNYTFSPIQGDVNNDGHVDITDLRTVAAFYDQTNDTYNLTGDSVIDIFDLVVVAANYAFEY